MTAFNSQTVPPSRLQNAERIQARDESHAEYVAELATLLIAKTPLPSIIVYKNGAQEWIADGLHRLDAAKKAKRPIRVEFREGTRNDAIVHACGANTEHGLRRTNADKRRAVTLALQTFPEQADRAIAQICVVGADLVGDVRRQLSANDSSTGARIGRDGKRRKLPNRPSGEAATDGLPSQPDQVVALRKSRNGQAQTLNEADDFDPAKLDAMPVKKTKSGRPIIDRKLRTEVQKHIGGLIRCLKAMELYDEFERSLSAIAKRLKEV